ncbi:MAG: aminoglycoside phosphotransferase [Tepidiforma sp.]|nr:phosphotransferase family protein [Tepidiforma sp.]GIW17568.1 MAG: aminoglycoside phosphotransferase [Tepidiforma sp.]
MEEALARYLAPRLEAADVRVTNLLRIPGGASRETWMFDAEWTDPVGGRQSAPFVLRKDPPASLLETDREAEYAFYSAFWGTDVPVPRMRWLENDPSVLGGPFFIMDRILGCESATARIIAPPYTAVQPKIAENMYRILAAIATFDWRGTGIERVTHVPTPETAWQHELDHWERILDTEAMEPQPIMKAAIRWLRANPPPPAQRISVVHGDYRVGNFLYREDGGIYGIVDWEMAHLGDPLEDLAWSFNQSWHWAKDGRPGGIVDRETAIAHWERYSGLRADPAALYWWEVFSHVKCQGIWVTGARSFAEGRTNELILPLVAYSLINAQDQYLLRTMGRLP